MELQRRSFLGAILASIAAGTLATNTSLAIAPTKELGPIAETIRQYQELVAYHTEMKDDDKDHGITQRFDKLLSYTMNNFEKPSTSNEDVAKLRQAIKEEFSRHRVRDFRFNRTTDFADLSEEKLQSVVESIIPVVVARHVLGVSLHGMYVKTNKMESWTPFVQTYADLLPNG
jgi:hypothetical protein